MLLELEKLRSLNHRAQDSALLRLEHLFTAMRPKLLRFGLRDPQLTSDLPFGALRKREDSTGEKLHEFAGHQQWTGLSNPSKHPRHANMGKTVSSSPFSGFLCLW